jgi:hypothetical protein
MFRSTPASFATRHSERRRRIIAARAGTPLVGLLAVIFRVVAQPDQQESDEQLDDMCKQRDDIGTMARAYRVAGSDTERQVFAQTLLGLWHHTNRTRNEALHARLIRDAARS